jgi:hypothetical protein
MIHLLSGSTDENFISELKEAGVLAPDVMERIDISLGRPEHCLLDNFLLSGADFIKADEWISFLIRRHGCHRFGRVTWSDDVSAPATGDLPTDGNIPYRRCMDGRAMVAVLRPDKLPATSERLKMSRPLWAAATLHEIRDLRNAWSGSRREMP